jgi:hypothetical protein
MKVRELVEKKALRNKVQGLATEGTHLSIEEPIARTRKSLSVWGGAFERRPCFFSFAMEATSPGEGLGAPGGKRLRNKEGRRIGALLTVLISFVLILGWIPQSLAQDVAFELSLPRDSLGVLLQALDGTTISYQGKSREDLQAGQLFVGRTRITQMGEGQILTELEGTIWMHYLMRPEQAVGLPLGKSLEIKPNVDFSCLLSLIPEIDELTKKLILRATMVTLNLKKAEGFYELLIQVPGVEAIIRSEINKALQEMKPEILDLEPYLVPQELSLEDSRWKADRTLVVEPKEVKIEVRPDALKVRACARVKSKPIDKRDN